MQGMTFLVHASEVSTRMNKDVQDASDVRRALPHWVSAPSRLQIVVAMWGPSMPAMEVQ